MSEPAIFFDLSDRNAELSQMALDHEGLLWVLQQAHQEGGYSSSNDVKGWRLIVTHDKAVRALRERFCGPHWEKEEAENQEGIRNPTAGQRIIVANFDDFAGDPDPKVTPTNLRPKGNASKRKARCNQTGWLPGLPIPEPIHEEYETWVLGIFSDDNGFTGELCLPLEFHKRKLSKLVKRIIIKSKDDGLPVQPLHREPSGPVEEIDIQITRRS